MAVRADVGSGLQDVEETLDPGFLGTLDGDHHPLAFAFLRGLPTFFDQVIVEDKDVTGGVWEGVRHGGLGLACGGG